LKNYDPDTNRALSGKFFYLNSISHFHHMITTKHLIRGCTLIKVLVLTTSVLFTASCKKSVSSTDTAGGSNPPITPITTNSTTDTGISYSAAALCNYNPDPSQLTARGWTLAFEDNFDGDLSKWDAWTAGGSTNELQYYQPANLSIANGVLSISAKKENVTGITNPSDKTLKDFKYTSGRIESKTRIGAGANTPKVRISARIKLPAGYGMRTVFMSYENPWPIKGHINMLVADGQAPKRYITNYFYGNVANVNAVANSFGYLTATEDLTSCYHVFEMEWTRDALTFYLDGKVAERKTSGSHIQDLFDKNQRLSLYLSVQSELIFRTKIQLGIVTVDWIRVYTSK
jgi:beta-glucanase (GH16 family)